MSKSLPYFKENNAVYEIYNEIREVGFRI